MNGLLRDMAKEVVGIHKGATEVERARCAEVCRKYARGWRRRADDLDASGEHGTAEVLAEKAQVAFMLANAIEEGE